MRLLGAGNMGHVLTSAPAKGSRTRNLSLVRPEALILPGNTWTQQPLAMIATSM